MWIKRGVYCSNNKTLTELYALYEDKLYEYTDTNKRIARKILKTEDEFYNTLTDAQKEQFEQICNLKNENYAETGKNIFMHAFCLATNLMIETQNKQ